MAGARRRGSRGATLAAMVLLGLYGGRDDGCFQIVGAKQQHQTHKLLVDVVLSGDGIFVDGAREREQGKLQVGLMLGPMDDIGMAVTQLCEERKLSEEGCEAVASLVGQRFSEYQDSVRGRIASMSFDDAFRRLLRTRESFSSFPELADAAFSSDTFHDIGDWWRYHEMLGDAFVDEADLSLFSEEPIFHFTCPYWTWGDPEAAHIAGNVSSQVSSELFAVGDALLGYRSGALPNHANGKLPTTNTCRHVMQLSLLIKTLLADRAELSKLKVVEIGGGYGNMARLFALAYGFRHWTIFDMRFMNKLQGFYFESTLNATVLRNVVAEDFEEQTSKSSFTSHLCYDDDEACRVWAAAGECMKNPEFMHERCRSSCSQCESSSNFTFNLVDTKHLNTWYVLYAYSKVWPSPEIVNSKLELLKSRLSVIDSIESNHKNTVTVVFARRPGPAAST
ncbi:hypothetical protein GUITHDRAFT_122381 [Guillardia theta CCMP2712]|uniref:ShKT domain-containing protein n=1 Tax=Guillardia theta (strain CCMP2712) TaxID=905079 RepID=L1I5B3_GUITC|nr:hypothetical protein GUITHDRAFT_122381 [Guillardia theta CCMP2712]EKX31421.1 hypothetical protein GUITHDRAFT_122381 [Guillardia theta CCMP2712]|eukprot:XP_005818401.1 hypothetical protein GUITHDRAFT_122381 [Guillardia theta CCMP2712]